jgi:hypothetical protein
VQLAKTELRRTADAAARYGATGLSINPATVRSRAKTSASENTVDGTSLTLVDADIELGSWNSSTQTFTVLTGSAENSATAVRINAARSSTKGNPIPLLFARVMGVTSCSITASTVTVANSNYAGAFVGFSGIDVKNNTYIGSYNSSVSTSPSQATSNQHASVSSNALASAGGATLDGNLILGPAGSNSGFTVSGTTVALSTAIARTASPAWSPGINPGSVPQNYSVSGTTTLPGGTYWFTSLAVSGTLRFSSPAILYVNGNVDLSGTLEPTSMVPRDLKIYQIGTHTFGDSNGNGINLTAAVYAPNSAFNAKNNLTFCGCGIFDTITAKNNSEFYYDEDLGNATGTPSISMVK